MNLALPFTLDSIKQVTNTYPTPFHIYDEERIRFVARQLQGYALGLSDMTSDLLDGLRKRSSAGIAADTPPVGNAGGKLPQTPKKRRGKDA